MEHPRIVSRGEWLAARKGHLSKEKEFTRLRDQLSAERRKLPELPGTSVFYRDASGGIFHTYSSYARGGDLLLGTYNYLDLTPKGRDEDALNFTMVWVRHHDRYGDAYSVDSMAPYTPPERSDCSCGSSMEIDKQAKGNAACSM